MTLFSTLVVRSEHSRNLKDLTDFWLLAWAAAAAGSYITQLSQIVEAVCVAVKREVEREMMRALLLSFPPAPKYEQELGAFKGMVSIRSKANDDGQKRMECLL